MCYVFKQLIINKHAVTFQEIQKEFMTCPEAGMIRVCFILGDE